jgi:Domain of unknown function (DUF5668)
MNSHDSQENGRDSKQTGAPEKTNLDRSAGQCRWDGNRHHISMGVIFIAVGGFFMLRQWGYLETDWLGIHFRWWHLFLLISVSGLCEILSARNLRHVGKGIYLMVLGFWLFACFDHSWGWTFFNSWPVILIALGVNVVLRGMSRSRHG